MKADTRMLLNVRNGYGASPVERVEYFSSTAPRLPRPEIKARLATISLFQENNVLFQDT